MATTTSINQAEKFRGSVLTLDGKVVEGMKSIRGVGQSTPRFDYTSAIDTVRRYEDDVPNPGTYSVVLNYIAASPQHQKLKAANDNRNNLAFTLLFQGDSKNGLKTTTAENVGKFTASTITAGAEGVATVTRDDGLTEGDYLVPDGGTASETLIVTEADYTGSSIKIKVKKEGGGNVAAVAASQNYDIKRPAARETFTAKVTNLNTDPAGGTYDLSFNLEVEGKVTTAIGTPDLP